MAVLNLLKSAEGEAEGEREGEGEAEKERETEKQSGTDRHLTLLSRAANCPRL